MVFYFFRQVQPSELNIRLKNINRDEFLSSACENQFFKADHLIGPHAKIIHTLKKYILSLLYLLLHPSPPATTHFPLNTHSLSLTGPSLSSPPLPSLPIQPEEGSDGGTAAPPLFLPARGGATAAARTRRRGWRRQRGRGGGLPSLLPAPTSSWRRGSDGSGADEAAAVRTGRRRRRLPLFHSPLLDLARGGGATVAV